MHKKTKGSIAELAVAQRLMKEGFAISFPFGENQRYDLIAERNGRFWRIQVKYSTPKNETLRVNCRSSNNWSVKKYTSDEIDLIAIYDGHGGEVYFVECSDFKDNMLTLRLQPTKNNQEKLIHHAGEFASFPF
jgi:Holliday junction resolvase-like predicted endonuclease